MRYTLRFTLCYHAYQALGGASAVVVNEVEIQLSSGSQMTASMGKTFGNRSGRFLGGARII